MHNKAMPQKPLQQQLREMANASTVEAARRGFAEIDRHANRAKEKVKSLGIEGADELIESLGTFFKKKAAELMTGRPQG